MQPIYRTRPVVATGMGIALLGITAFYLWLLFGPTPRRFEDCLRAGDAVATGRFLTANAALANQPLAFGERYTRPLHVAVACSHLHLVELLLEAGADPAGTDIAGRTALHEAAQLYHGQTHRVLVRSAQEIAPSIMTRPVPVDPAIVRKLVQVGCPLAARDLLGQTALHHACMAANVSAVQTLLACGADPLAVDSNGDVPLGRGLALGHLLASQDQLVAITRLLLERGTPTGHVNLNGDALLHLVCQRFPTSVPLVKLLLEFGADARLRNRAGKLPLELVRMPEDLRALEGPLSKHLVAGKAVPGTLTSRRQSKSDVEPAYCNVTPDSAIPGEQVTVRYRLRNRGDAPSSKVRVEFYLAPRDSTTFKNCRLLSSAVVDAIPAGEATTKCLHSITLPELADPCWKRGKYFQIVLCIDGQDQPRDQDPLANLWLDRDELVVSRFRPCRLAGFDAGNWHLDMDGNRTLDTADQKVSGLGQAGDIALAADIDGDGDSELVLFRAGKWFFDTNHNGKLDAEDLVLESFGEAGDQPLLGDWDGTGKIRVGVYRAGFWYLDIEGKGNFSKAERKGPMGKPGDIAVVGDWNGDGRTDLGVFRDGLWFLDQNKDGQWHEKQDYQIRHLGQAGDIPVPGDWAGDGKTRIGIYRQGIWCLDLNGDGRVDHQFNLSLGENGQPVTGWWKPRR